MSYDHFGLSPDTVAILVSEGHALKERDNFSLQRWRDHRR